MVGTPKPDHPDPLVLHLTVAVAVGVSQAVDPVQKDEISLDGGAVTAVEADGGDKTIIVSRTGPNDDSRSDGVHSVRRT